MTGKREMEVIDTEKTNEPFGTSLPPGKMISLFYFRN